MKWRLFLCRESKVVYVAMLHNQKVIRLRLIYIKETFAQLRCNVGTDTIMCAVIRFDRMLTILVNIHDRLDDRSVKFHMQVYSFSHEMFRYIHARNIHSLILFFEEQLTGGYIT